MFHRSADMETPSKQKKGACKHFMTAGDLHELYRGCRTCSRDDQCLVCTEWSAEDWKQFVDNPRARSDKRKERTDSKTIGKSLSSDQGEFLVTQDDPVVGNASEKSPIIVVISTAMLTLCHTMAGKRCVRFPPKSHHVIRLMLTGRETHMLVRRVRPVITYGRLVNTRSRAPPGRTVQYGRRRLQPIYRHNCLCSKPGQAGISCVPGFAIGYTG